MSDNIPKPQKIEKKYVPRLKTLKGLIQFFKNKPFGKEAIKELKRYFK